MNATFETIRTCSRTGPNIVRLTQQFITFVTFGIFGLKPQVQVLGVHFRSPVVIEVAFLPGLSVRVLGPAPRVQACGPEVLQRVAIVSGRATREIAEAALAGCDTFLTGESLHEVYHDPVEYGINVIFAGHYATEKVGLQALARHLETEFGLDTVFVDLPTGL